MPPKRVRAKMEPSNVVDIGSPEFKTDEFRMYGLKVIDCARRYSHDWTTCPFAHPAEKARRRDPRKFMYSGVACPHIKQANCCPLGDDCQFAHNVFEYWLHPTRYRTQLCNIAASCNRTVCFFAHTIEELRVPLPLGPAAADGGHSMRQLQHQQPTDLNPFSRSSSQLTGTSGAGGSVNMAMTGMAFDLQAKYILQQLIASRQMAAGLHASNSPTNDLSEIQKLIALLQHQQALAGVSDRNPDLQLTFLNSLLQSLAQEVSVTFMQNAERDRLMKLVEWMYVQMVQNRQSLFSSTDSSMPFSQPTQETTQTRFVQQWGDLFGSRRSLTRIPEATEAAPLAVSHPVMRASHESAFPHMQHNPFVAGLDPDPRRLNPGRRPASLDSRLSPPPLGIFNGGRDLRRSDESSGTRMSGTGTSGTFSVNRSSGDSERINRHSHNTLTPDSSRMSLEDPNQMPEFEFFHEWHSSGAMTTQPPPPPPGSTP